MFFSACRLSLEVFWLKPACSWSAAVLRVPPSLICAEPSLVPPLLSPPPPQAAAIMANPATSATHLAERRRCTKRPPVRDAGPAAPCGPGAWSTLVDERTSHLDRARECTFARVRQ